MNVVVWLDVPLVLFGLLALSPLLWSCLRRKRATPSSRLRRIFARLRAPLLYAGLFALVAAGIDLGWAVWEQEYVFVHDDGSSGLRMPYEQRFSPHAEAPDFTLPLLDEDDEIRLSDFREHKPVVLIFGSFS